MPGYKDLKLTKKLFSGRALRSLLFEMQLIRFQSSDMRRKHSCEMLCKIIPLIFRFFSPVFVLFGTFLVDSIPMGKVFGKTFRIVGLGGR